MDLMNDFFAADLAYDDVRERLASVLRAGGFEDYREYTWVFLDRDDKSLHIAGWDGATKLNDEAITRLRSVGFVGVIQLDPSPTTRKRPFVIYPDGRQEELPFVRPATVGVQLPLKTRSAATKDIEDDGASDGAAAEQSL